MGKAQLRPSKKLAKQSSQSEEEEEEEYVKKDNVPSWVKDLFPDRFSLVAGVMLIILILGFALLIALNSAGDIEPYLKKGPLEMEEIIMPDEVPPTSSRKSSKAKKDKEDLLETYQAVDAIERSVQHGNVAAAKVILHQLLGTKTLGEKDTEALVKLIDDAENLSPIANISNCHVQEAMDHILEKGGKIITDGKEQALMMADFDHDEAEADGRGRGLAALMDIKAGTSLLEVPASLQMSLWTAKSSPTLGKVFKEQKDLLFSFNGLALFLLHESHKLDSIYRPYLCSLPLHVPLPFLWDDADLPADFLNDKEIVEDRILVRELVSHTFNNTVLPLQAKYPDLFTTDQYSMSKWSWACSIVLSRAIGATKSWTGSYTLESSSALDPKTQHDIITGKTPDNNVVHMLMPGLDMLNHESSEELGCKFSLKSDGTAVVTACPAGLKRGHEIAISYGSHLCGSKPINQYGFVLPPCPGSEDTATEQQAGEDKPQDQGEEPAS
mmetsp:Transcript_13645/g.21312  ORF Transcript_13645/g.21312 Transcript_13645/m.21312 type:complete len:497 (-) Transcript_13645:47-1537(-)|eukprot:CAMPEP_0184305670 /NCGR_PEP_ID=MMETSP1049-20130417/14885_1 /TAXON_ID=77928 /ORGANISM="Proteomonas sulcata, Strain CCMP704" /LENGTH=496 /DNA_ID=CAMNT_0026617785 /DNA_START=31 /DNA_END=1521 /DNA_ORIENTATION=+